MDSHVDILHLNVFVGGYLNMSLLLGLLIILLLFWRSWRKQSYWKEKGIPYIKPYPLFGNVLDYFKKSAHEVEMERYQKYGKLFGHYEGSTPLLSVGHPDIIRSVLMKDFLVFSGRRKLETGHKITDSMLPMTQGEDWKRIRSVVSATFSSGKIKKMMSIFKDCARTLVKNFKEASERGDPVEVKRFYGAFSMDVIASSAFSTKIDSHNDPNNKFVSQARSIFNKTLNWRIIVMTVFPGIMKYFEISIFSRKVLDFFSKVTLQIIEERKKTGLTRNDFLQLLLDTVKENDEENKLTTKDDDNIAKNYEKEETNPVFKDYFAKKSMSQDEMVAQCIIFFLAGYDTSASTLSFTCYNLALNPEIQEKLIEEIDEALKANDGEFTYEAIQGMKYLDNVIAETLRIFSPNIRLERAATEDYKLADTGLIIPKGMIVTVPIYGLHMDPEYFPNPERFNPDRFTAEERAKRPPCTYLPFGAGPRNCVGMRFALTEVKVCLAHVLSNFRIRKCPETKVPLEFLPGQSLLEPKNITLFMEIRTDNVKAL